MDDAFFGRHIECLPHRTLNNSKQANSYAEGRLDKLTLQLALRSSDDSIKIVPSTAEIQCPN
jgi:hypothetical protein